MKILLVAINAKYIHSNLAVYSLKSYVSAYKHNIEIAEFTINQKVDDILADIYMSQPKVLCISCYLWNIVYAKQLVIEIKKVLPNLHIWLGGPEVSYNAVELLAEYWQIDGIMIGEGEETFLELVEFYHGNGHDLSGIRGITYRHRVNADTEPVIVENACRSVLNINKVPFVYKDMEKFKNKIIYYESSRGCPFSCSYCLSSIDKCLRFRDLELVKKELQIFIDAGIPQVKFVDRTFNCDSEHARSIWSFLAKHDQGRTNFHFEVAADLLQEEELQLIESMRPGLIQLEIGVQSTNPQTIQEIHRVMDFDQVGKVVSRIRSGGNIHQHLDLIAGLPYEDYQSFKRSFNMVYSLQPEQLQLGFLKVLKGSYMHKKADEYRLLYQESPPFEVLSTKWLSYEEVIRLKDIEEMVEVYYNSMQFQYTMPVLEEFFSDAFTMYETLSLYYKKNQLNMMNHSRITRYEILFAFVREYDAKREEEYRKMLTIDLYLRDNVKNRPEFAGASKVTQKETADFYQQEVSQHQYLQGYEQYDKRQMRKMTHLEKIDGKLVLFDYRNRDPLTNQARVYYI